MHILRLLWLGVAGALTAVAVTGTVVAAPLPLVLILAGITAAVHATYPLWGRAGRCPSVFGRYAAAAAYSAPAVLLVAGLSSVAGLSTVPVLLLLVATSPPATRWYAERVGRQTESGQRTGGAAAQHGRRSTGATAPNLRLVSANEVSALSDEELCLAWRTTFTALHRATGANELAQIAAARRDYLDELERRYPTAVRRWISSGARAASNPARYLGTDQE